jgi:hypothetical protein
MTLLAGQRISAGVGADPGGPAGQAPNVFVMLAMATIA